jgi:Family of unknown function (DUF6056)
LPGLVAIVGAVYLTLVAVDSRPIADDWQEFAAIPHVGVWAYVHGWWIAGSGRFTGFVGVWVMIRLLGTAAVIVTPLVLLLALWTLSAWALRGWARGMRAVLRWREALLLALLGTVAMLSSAPSLFDVVGWFAGSLVYLIAVVGVAAVAATYGHFSSSPSGVNWRSGGSLLLVAYVAAGCHEITGILIFLAAGLGIVTVRDLSAGETRTARTRALYCVTLGALAGTAVNLLSPGSRNRASVQGAHVSLGAATRTAWHNLTFLSADAHSGVLLLALATGVLAWQLLPAPSSRRGRLWTGAWGIFLLLVPWLLTSALTAWGGSTESDDRSPFRTSFLFTSSVMLAIAAFVVLLLSAFPTVLRGRRATLIALVLSTGGIVGFAHHTAPLIRAERMRARAVDLRGSSVRRQLSEHRRSIMLQPAPLLSVYTQAFDLSFARMDQQRPWLISALRSYYGIPAADHVVIARTQPRGYCLPGVTASWVGVRSCQELAAGR